MAKTYKPRGFGVTDTDVIIDFQKKEVIYQNQSSIFDKKTLAITLLCSTILNIGLYLSMIDRWNRGFSLSEQLYDFGGFSVGIWLICLFPLISLAFVYSFVLLLALLEHPKTHKARAWLYKLMRHKKEPFRTTIIKNPKHVQVTMVGYWEVFSRAIVLNTEINYISEEKKENLKDNQH